MTISLERTIVEVTMRRHGYPSLIIGLIAFLFQFSVQLAQAELRDNYYVSSVHSVSFGRPNEAWKFLEIPPPNAGNGAQLRPVAVFSNGDGQAIALLVHRPIGPDNTIFSADDLDRRWPSMVNEIIALVGTGESSPTVDESRHDITGDAATFDIHYRSVSPADGEFLENWVTGFVVRDTTDQQHLYAVRCAAPQAAFKAWESDFARIMPTLRFEGQRRTPVFAPHSSLVHWWFIFAGVAVLGVLLMGLRSRRRKGAVLDARRSLQHMEASGKAHAELQNVPDQLNMPTDSSYGPERIGWPSDLPRVPEHQLFSSGAERPATPVQHEPGQMPDASVTSSPAVAVQSEVATGLWKCACGRINPISYDFCARCNLDRVKK